MEISTIDRKRETLKGLYKSRKWWTRVTQMTDNQVIAIFTRLKRQNKI